LIPPPWFCQRTSLCIVYFDQRVGE
jgi:hypothetical protein